MDFQLFPQKEYWLKSAYTPSESINALAEKVKKPQIILFSLFKTSEGFFEGVVNDPGFRITYKQLWYGGRNTNFRNCMPIINGTVSQMGGGSSIHINCSVSNWIYLTMVLPVIIIAAVSFAHPPKEVLMFIPLYFVSIFIHRYRYMQRLRKDKELLKLIFRAEEEGALF